MKKNSALLALLIATGIFMISSCEKDPIATDTQVGMSRITYYADITVNGDKYMSVVQGTPFTDPGAEATANGKSLEVKTSGSVEVNTPGIYILTYNAVNADGYSASKSRTIAVLPSAEQAGVDVSGDYKNVGSFSYTASIQKLAPGFYYTDNCWGGDSGAIIPAFFICVDGHTIVVPLQNSPYGRLQGEGTLSVSGLISWSITLLDQGPLTVTKKWQK